MFWNISELAATRWTVPVKSRKARAIESGMSLSLHASFGDSNTVERGPSKAAVIAGGGEAGWSWDSGTLCPIETPAKNSRRRAERMRVIQGPFLGSRRF